MLGHTTAMTTHKGLHVHHNNHDCDASTSLCAVALGKSQKAAFCPVSREGPTGQARALAKVYTGLTTGPRLYCEYIVFGSSSSLSHSSVKQECKVTFFSLHNLNRVAHHIIEVWVGAL